MFPSHRMKVILNARYARKARHGDCTLSAGAEQIRRYATAACLRISRFRCRIARFGERQSGLADSRARTSRLGDLRVRATAASGAGQCSAGSGRIHSGVRSTSWRITHGGCGQVQRDDERHCQRYRSRSTGCGHPALGRLWRASSSAKPLASQSERESNGGSTARWLICAGEAAR